LIIGFTTLNKAHSSPITSWLSILVRNCHMCFFGLINSGGKPNDNNEASNWGWFPPLSSVKPGEYRNTLHSMAVSADDMVIINQWFLGAPKF
jgi:hypothetical protein